MYHTEKILKTVFPFISDEMYSKWYYSDNERVEPLDLGMQHILTPKRR